MSSLSTSRHGNIDASRLHAGHQAFHQYNKHYRNYTRWLSNLQTRQPTIHLQQKVFNHFMMSHPMNAPARRGHSSSVTPKLAVHQHYTETRHSSWSAAMCAANHAVQLMSHVSTAAAMTTRQTSCVPVQRIPVASLGSCQTHLVVEEAMKPRDAGCTTVTPLRRPQHAHTCLDEMHRRFRRARHRADNHAPGQPNGTKSLATTIPSPPGYHSPRIITVSPSSHSQMGRAGTLLWWRSINSPGINAQLPLLPRPGYRTPLRILFMASTLTGDCRHGKGT